VVTDVGDKAQVDNLAARAVAEFGRFDTWVNNAGVSIFGMIDEVSVEDMHRVMDTVYWGTVYGCLAAVKHYTTRDADHPGAIVNVGSLFGDRATPIQSSYASAKHAVHGFTDALRVEQAAEGNPVSVTLVHPGRIDTPYNEHAQSYFPRQPTHRGMIYPPKAVADAILFAAAHPTRDLFVGGQAKALALAAAVAPSVVDKVMQRYMFWTQHDERLSIPRDDSALHHASPETAERGSHHGWFRKGSAYLAATTNPAVRGAMTAPSALTAAALRLIPHRDAEEQRVNSGV
jgi:NAD(P)-dependent dehydrogenase (short-subunit alcohol dehydrogenase family)